MVAGNYLDHGPFFCPVHNSDWKASKRLHLVYPCTIRAMDQFQPVDNFKRKALIWLEFVSEVIWVKDSDSTRIREFVFFFKWLRVNVCRITGTDRVLTRRILQIWQSFFDEATASPFASVGQGWTSCEDLIWMCVCVARGVWLTKVLATPRPPSVYGQMFGHGCWKALNKRIDGNVLSKNRKLDVGCIFWSVT